MTRADLRAALANANVQAFLRVIRAGEGTTDDNGYRRMFTGPLFDSYADHPNQVHKAGALSSTAAGAYQFLAKTWAGLVNLYGFPDFSPQCQDEGAVALILGRGALDEVMAGNLAAAIALCNNEWASLPGSPYGQPTRTLAQATRTYIEAGGVLAQGKPSPAPGIPAQHQEKPMLPFVAAGLSALIQAAPSLIRIFGDSPQAEKNAKAAEVVANVAMQATGEPTVEGAVKAIESDPAKAAAYREAVHQSMGDLVGLMIQAQEADDASRDKALDRNITLAKETGGKWLYLLGFVAVLVVVASYAITWNIMFGNGTTISDETKALLLGQIVIFGFVTVLAFLFGSNIQNRITDAKKAGG